MTPPRLNLVRNDAPGHDGPEPQEAVSGNRGEHTTASDDDFRRDAETAEKVRILEALLFAASEPLDEATLGKHLKQGDDVRALLDAIAADYRPRGINLVRVAGKWSFRTAEDLSYLLERYTKEERKLSKAAMETLSIIAYHQPVTRA